MHWAALKRQMKWTGFQQELCHIIFSLPKNVKNTDSVAHKPLHVGHRIRVMWHSSCWNPVKLIHYKDRDYIRDVALLASFHLYLQNILHPCHLSPMACAPRWAVVQWQYAVFMWYAQLDVSGISHVFIYEWRFTWTCLFAVVVIWWCFMIGVSVWWVNLAPQNIPSAIVLTLGNKGVLYVVL